MTTFDFVRTPGVPAVLANSTMYMVRDAATGKLSIIVTDEEGNEAHGLNVSDVASMLEQHAPAALATARNIALTGDGSWNVNFNGAADATAAFTLANSGITPGQYAVASYDAKGRAISGRALAATDLPTDITSNTSGKAATAGVADTATALATARTINGVPFNGTQNITINAEDATARVAVADIGTTVPGLVDGVIPSQFLPQYVDDVIEVEAYDQLPGEVNALPENGAPAKGKIYVVVDEDDTTTIYRWTGSTYIPIPSGLGTADTAVALATARSISITGDASWTVSFKGNSDVTGVLTLANSGITAGEYAVATYDSKGRAVSGRALVMADIPELDHTKVVSARSVLATGSWAE